MVNKELVRNVPMQMQEGFIRFHTKIEASFSLFKDSMLK